MSPEDAPPHGSGGPPGGHGSPTVRGPGSPPQSSREGSRWRRKRPAPSAARPLILFSLLTSVVFVGILSAVFLPQILRPQENLPQFFLGPPSAGAGNTTIEVTDATGPRSYAILRVVVTDTDAAGNVREVANATLDQPSLGAVTLRDPGGNRQLDKGDSFVVATASGHQYVLAIVYVTADQTVARSNPWTAP